MPMKGLNKIMDFNWNSEDEWDSYIKELENLYSAMGKYMAYAAYLKSLNGVDITYGSTKTNAFFDILTVKEWREFMNDFYAIEPITLEDDDNQHQESTRIFWNGNRGYEDGEIVCEPPFYCIIEKSYELFTSAGLKENENYSEFPNQEELIVVAENLVRELITLSPLFNQKSFFLLSLRYIPEAYATTEYGDLEKIEDIMGWKNITNWPVIPRGWQIHTYTDTFWSKIADALHILYGFCPRDRYWNTSIDFWDIVAKYVGENIHKRYMEHAKRSIIEAYARNPELSKYVSGTSIGKEFLFAEIEIDSLTTFDLKGMTIEDYLSPVEIPLKYDNIIRFVAPQMFLNLATLYLSENTRWVLGFYIPKSLLERKVPDVIKIESIHVNPININIRMVLPTDWRMHILRNILNTINFHLEYLAMSTAEYEDFEGEEE